MANVVDIGRGYRSAGDDLAEMFKEFGKRHDKEKAMREVVQGYLNVAKGIQTQDPKTGKPKPFFTEDQLSTVQHLLDRHQAYQAGSAAAAMGMGKNMVQTVRTAEAKQAAAAEKAKAQQQTMMQGPVTTTDRTGRGYIWNPHTGAWQTNTAVPRNTAGQTTEEQANLQKDMQTKMAAQQQLQRTGFATALKSMNLSPQALFDPSKQESGTVVPGRGFLNGDAMVNEYGTGDPNQPPPEFTHVRIGYEPPQLDKNGKVAVDKKGKPIDPGVPGRVLSLPEFNALRDTQASLAGPTASDAWKWINTNPASTQTDFNGNPWTEESIAQYNKLLPGVSKQFNKQIAQGFELPAQKTETTTAPAAAPAAMFPQSDQPVTLPPPESTDTTVQPDTTNEGD